MLRAVIAFLMCVLLSSAATAQKRVALVIGNSAYQHTPRLANPRNDASDIATALKKHGFQIIDGLDLDKAAFDRKVRDFATALEGVAAGVFFYAGHGLQVGGVNYLVPVDAQLTTAAALEFEMIRLDVVHRVMERQTNTNVLFLDACRDNPLARNLARAMGTRSSEIGRGLAAVESGVGTLISFSTQPGNVALDGVGRNSPFASALVKHMSASNDDLSAILINVRNEVMKETQRKQVPWEHSALTGRFYFNAVAQTAAPPPVASLRLSEAAEAWDRTKDTRSVAVLEAFIARYKDTFYADLARAQLDDLKKQQVAVATPPPAAKPTPSKPAQPAVSVAPTPRPARCDGVETTVGNERKCLKPKDSFKDCSGCPELVVVPAGSFVMGSPGIEGHRIEKEGAQQRVMIAKPFAAGKFEVTFAEWDACVAASGCKGYRPGDSGWGRGKRPVIAVSWDDAKLYVEWLSKRTRKTYRLLSEAEWEYAARAGSSTEYAWGDEIGKNRANCHGCGSQWDMKQTAPVGSFAPNAFGLYDMHGNVWEWVEDCGPFVGGYDRMPEEMKRTGAPWTAEGCPSRILRGGGWSHGTEFLHSSFRGEGHLPDSRYGDSGIRVARTLD